MSVAMTQKEFEDTYHMKRVKVAYPDGFHGVGFCTAALLDYESHPLLAIDCGPGQWNTFQLQDDLSDLQYFTVIEGQS
jgi:hypothetical protein